MTATKMPSVRDEVLWLLDTTFASWNWAHKSLLDSVKTLTVAEARWQPGRRAHSVWEQINHVAHWKAYIVDRIAGRRPVARQAWPAAGRTAADLRRSIARLTRLQDELRQIVQGLNPEAFALSRSGKYSLAKLLMGSAAHESYHAGQILLTRKLCRDTVRRTLRRPARASSKPG
ncbi:MAG TPA: DinB family protein [bacterium]|nr:DinB family protein [bacterium]